MYAELENEAAELLGYACCQVPPLLRTGAYAHTLTTTARPGTGTGEVDRLVTECVARQALVIRASPPLPATIGPRRGPGALPGRRAGGDG